MLHSGRRGLVLDSNANKYHTNSIGNIEKSHNAKNDKMTFWQEIAQIFSKKLDMLKGGSYLIRRTDA